MADEKEKIKPVETETTELTDKQQYIKSQMKDLSAKVQSLMFQLDQVKAAQQVFKQAFLDASKEVSEEISAESKK